MIEKNFEDEEINKNLLKLRDEWRDCLNPEILDESLVPLRTSSIFSLINLEANKIISKLLI